MNVNEADLKHRQPSDRELGRQIGRQTERQTDRQTISGRAIKST